MHDFQKRAEQTIVNFSVSYNEKLMSERLLQFLLEMKSEFHPISQKF